MSLTLTLARGGGEVSGSGTNIELDGTIAGGAIESVEMYGDTEQTTYSGIQLIPFTTQDITLGSVRSYVKGGYLYMDGTSTGEVSGDNNNWKTNFGFTLPAGTYTFSLTGAKTTYYIRRLSDQADLASLNPYRSSQSFTLSESTQVYFSAYYYKKSWDNELIPVSLVVGGNPPTPFEPYVGGTASPNPDYPQEVQTVTGRQVVTISDGGSQSQEYEINLGKNIVYAPDGTTSRNNVELSVSSGNVRVYNTGATSYVAFGVDNTLRNSNYGGYVAWGGTVLRAGTYTLSYTKVSGSTTTTGGGGNFLRALVYTRPIGDTGRLETIAATVELGDATNSATFTLEKDVQANVVVYLYATDATVDLTFNLQLERGSTATTYAPYFTPIELCKIGTYQDYIYKSGNDWYVHKETGEFNLADYKDLDGWYVTGGGGHCVKHMWANNFPITDIKPQPNITSLDYGLSNYFTECNYADLYNGVEKVGFAFGLDGIYLSNNDWTLEDFRTWVTGKVVDMYYIKTTPTDTQITNEALIAQLNALNAGTTYDGTTIITVASENLAGPLEVKASTTITKTYTEVEIGSPFTIADVEGKSSNTTLDGNVYVDWAYNKKQYSFDLFNLTPQDYADIRAFYDYQFNNSAFPTITVPELNIDKLPVYMEISSRNIINQCLLTDKLTIKFRETVQP